MLDELRAAFAGRHLGTPEELDRLRRERPAVRVDGGTGPRTWLLTRREDAAAMLRDPRLSRVAPVASAYPAHAVEMLSGIDAPRHTALRRAVAATFSTGAVEQRRPGIEADAARLLDGLLDRGGPADLYAEFCLPLATRATWRITGLPEEFQKDNVRWTYGYLGMTEFTPAACASSAAAQAQLVAAVVDAKRRCPGDDLISALLARPDVPEADLSVLVASLHVSGHVKTAVQLASALLVLLRRPDLLARLRAEPALVPDAVEEVLRFAPVPQVTHSRYATGPMRLAGVDLGRGDTVFAAIASANHDERGCPEPHRIRLDRTAPVSLTFGHGKHSCLGAVLARTLLHVGVGAFLARSDRLRGTAGPAELPWLDGFLARGPIGLPVVVAPAAGSVRPDEGGFPAPSGGIASGTR
ncbi:cytochrome P450 [Saccharopolyspora sp. CA-218241]|uniref:cytochrome P450 n=1 Tax=Saccharopolyspora sp. CA-218241 TaxID=3240027 RepID=UPI003D9882C2